jgi:alanyl-tRNA synthetase
VQKCVRTLDIEEVGKTTRHGTFFQMNGNFSFGDYFKEGAIRHAWELVTEPQDGGLGFDPDRIWATVYLDDDEAAEAWHRIAGLPRERIQRLGKKDNYWHTGAAGPGGPCSEIFFDRGPEFGPDGGPLVDTAGDRFLEIWNLVFMQYELTDVRSKEDFRIVGELPKKNIDTGMGLERVAYLLQGVDNMYEIDEVAPVLRRGAELAGVRYGADHDADVRLRVVADHVRSSLMLVGDGVTPGNEGRGYILRRLLRRAVRSMKLLAWTRRPCPSCLPVSRDAMKASYPELETDFARISSVAYAEEEAFRRTLASGTALFDTAVREATAAGTPSLSGEQAFSLHDTYGFPSTSPSRWPPSRACASTRRASARSCSSSATGPAPTPAPRRPGRSTSWPTAGCWPSTAPRTGGPTTHCAPTPGCSAWSPSSPPRRTPPARRPAPGEVTRVVLDRTPFYAESGGQVADAGVLTWDGGRAEVLDVQRPVRGLVAHQVRVLEGELREGAELTAEVDREWRLSACQAHSGTHVVHAALRQVLGPQALQSGSYNRPGYLRLDFAWQGALDRAAAARHRGRRQRRRPADHRVSASYMTLPEAQAIGALGAVRRDLRRAGPRRGDRWPVVARTLRWHPRAGQRPDRHAALTGESSVGSGSRRVEAVVGLEGFRYLARERDLVRQLGRAALTPSDTVRSGVSGMLARRATWTRSSPSCARSRTLAAAGAHGGRRARRRRGRRRPPPRRPVCPAATCARSPSTSAGGSVNVRVSSCWPPRPGARWLSSPR